MKPMEHSVGRSIRTRQGWGWRIGKDRGHFPASEDKAGLLTNRNRPVEGLACSQARSTACLAGSKEAEALQWRNDSLRFVF